MVIGDMLGAPREDAERLVDWTNRTTAFEDPRLSPDLGDVWQALEEFVPYVNAMIDEREANPTDDLTTAFIEAEVDGEQLSHEEVLMFFFLLMVAGNDSTRAVFTSGMKNLIEDPEQMELVRSGAVPLEQVVEEFVRYNPAFAYMRRTATRDTELAGARSAAGDKLALWYVSGNRDENVFDDPDHFDVRRDPNPHQGFGGGGRHFCLGAGLARLELKLWIEETLRRFPGHRPRRGLRAGQLDLPQPVPHDAGRDRTRLARRPSSRRRSRPGRCPSSWRGPRPRPRRRRPGSPRSGPRG